MKPFGYETSLPANFFPLRLMLAISAFATFGLGLAQVFTNIYTKDGTDNVVRWGLWVYKWCMQSETSVCVESDFPLNMCPEWESNHRAAQAFSVIVCVFSAICAASCWADILGLSPTLKLPDMLPIFTTVALSVLSLIQWSLLAAYFHQNICGLGALGENGYRLSSSFSITICIFFSTLFASSLFLLMRCVNPVNA